MDIHIRRKAQLDSNSQKNQKEDCQKIDSVRKMDPTERIGILMEIRIFVLKSVQSVFVLEEFKDSSATLYPMQPFLCIVAQLVERSSQRREVAGSSPVNKES